MMIEDNGIPIDDIPISVTLEETNYLLRCPGTNKSIIIYQFFSVYSRKEYEEYTIDQTEIIDGVETKVKQIKKRT